MRSYSARPLALSLSLLASSLCAQQFDVASVKPATPQPPNQMMIGMRGGPGSAEPGTMTWTNITLTNVIGEAYNVKGYQISATGALDSQLKSERYDITAKMPPTTTKEQYRLMLQNLLAERFHFTLHRISKEFQGFELQIGKGGPKLKETSPEDAAIDRTAQPAGMPAPPKRGTDGFAQLERPGMIAMGQFSTAGMAMRITGRAQTIARLLEFISAQMSGPVIDRTGLTGKYDFNLAFLLEGNAGPMTMNGGPPPPPPSGGGPLAPVSPPADDTPPLPLQGAIQQLGLKLEPKKIPLDVLVIEHADKVPTEN